MLHKRQKLENVKEGDHTNILQPQEIIKKELWQKNC